MLTNTHACSHPDITCPLARNKNHPTLLTRWKLDFSSYLACVFCQSAKTKCPVNGKKMRLSEASEAAPASPPGPSDASSAPRTPARGSSSKRGREEADAGGPSGKRARGSSVRRERERREEIRGEVRGSDLSPAPLPSSFPPPNAPPPDSQAGPSSFRPHRQRKGTPPFDSSALPYTPSPARHGPSGAPVDAPPSAPRPDLLRPFPPVADPLDLSFMETVPSAGVIANSSADRNPEESRSTIDETAYRGYGRRLMDTMADTALYLPPLPPVPSFSPSVSVSREVEACLLVHEQRLAMEVTFAQKMREKIFSRVLDVTDELALHRKSSERLTAQLGQAKADKDEQELTLRILESSLTREIRRAKGLEEGGKEEMDRRSEEWAEEKKRMEGEIRELRGRVEAEKQIAATFQRRHTVAIEGRDEATSKLRMAEEGREELRKQLLHEKLRYDEEEKARALADASRLEAEGTKEREVATLRGEVELWRSKFERQARSGAAESLREEEEEEEAKEEGEPDLEESEWSEEAEEDKEDPEGSRDDEVDVRSGQGATPVTTVDRTDVPQTPVHALPPPSSSTIRQALQSLPERVSENAEGESELSIEES